MKLKEKIDIKYINMFMDILTKYDSIQSNLTNKTLEINKLTNEVSELGNDLTSLRDIELKLYKKLAKDHKMSVEDVTKEIVEIISNIS